jgi:hypothetical protein
VKGAQPENAARHDWVRYSRERADLSLSDLVDDSALLQRALIESGFYG